jgi:hypothetical protein
MEWLLYRGIDLKLRLALVMPPFFTLGAIFG